jgi:gamma-glutamylcyclotransferase (GGCT)/AIG2-like uncharacterized protein YtfP
MNGQMLFVYGSIAEGMIHFEKIKEFVVSVSPAVARGQVYRMPIGYPAMTLEGQDTIQGNLLVLKVSDLLWYLLDSFYGYNPQDNSKSLFTREAIATMVDDKLIQAWSYVLPVDRVPACSKLIPGGDWKAALKENPPLPEKLTEKQKKYVLKLGASSGREIVPIDMALYRELMSLELIVDKGRRLALSRLGQELYRNLK